MADPTSKTIPSQVQELIAVLLAEIPLLEEPLATLLGVEIASQGENSPPDERKALCEVYTESLSRFGDAAGTVGFVGLQQVVAWLRENIEAFAAQPRPLNTTEMDLLGAWSGYVEAYLSNPSDQTTCQEFVSWLQTKDWLKPLDTAQADTIGALLLTPDFTAAISFEEQSKPAREQAATAEHVNLELPKDVQPDLLEALLQELPEQSQTFAVAIQRLVANGSMDDLNIAKRTAHTLKGAANTVGIRGIANLTHHLEDILDALFKHHDCIC
ncbi:hypothetical protein TI05_16235 [Achromatium sp. WMS3]|nr:hypothetical protein TI04_11625 [Achromatium sp. WMS2]KOR28802.1 hypothetical protein TI05_16235 [Achromatium sp. WMS3]